MSLPVSAQTYLPVSEFSVLNLSVLSWEAEPLMVTLFPASQWHLLSFNYWDICFVWIRHFFPCQLT